mmetsp:Transcript_10454/g.19243  ORF Transcript_10454/g.19243 Transcript_10454/m.19243 type:complete len:435 (+) Transcript_10454:45-1349(+)
MASAVEKYVSNAEVECATVPGLTAAPGPLDSVGIVGSGTMGGGIAMCCAEAGMRVKLLDIKQEFLDRGLAVIKKNYDRSLQRKSKSQAQVDGYLSLIQGTLDYADLKDCDIVVEAVFENMKIKQEIFTKFDEVCKPGCILSSNTSGLNIDAIASATKRPEDVIGCHFFSPANVMRLLENIRGAKSSPRTIATAMAFGVKIKKVTCLVGNCPGFVANRVMYQSGAFKLMQSGITPQDIDAASEGFGFKVGPFRMQDIVGLDLMARERVRRGEAEPKKFIVDAMYAAERFGQKNGKGYYRYGQGADPRGSTDPETAKIIESVWKETGVTPRTGLSSEKMVQELYFPVINEGFKCLEEGIALRPLDVDVCVVFGYNWPRATGGPMYYANAVGLPTVMSTLESMKLKPAALLKECVEKGWTLDSDGLKQRLSIVHSKL